MAFNDQTLIFSSAQALTSTSTASTNTYDVTGAGSGVVPNMVFGFPTAHNTPALAGLDIGTGDSVARPTLQMIVTTAAVSGGGATLQVIWEGAKDNGSGSPDTWYPIAYSPVYAVADLTAGAMLILPIPPIAIGEPLPRFYRVYYTIGTSTFSALAVTSQLLLNPPSFDNVLYQGNYELATA